MKMVTLLEDIPTIFSKVGGPKAIFDKISIWNGDITKLKVDAIVNAANKQLAGGGGVDGAIHRAAGHSQLQAECSKYDGCEVGDAVITSACKISHVKNIIHTVGPQIRNSLTQSHRDKLISCYRSSLELAVENNLKSIAFCCISTGVYGYPNDDAAETVSNFLVKWLKDSNKDDKITRIVLVTFLEVDDELYQEHLKALAESD